MNVKLEGTHVIPFITIVKTLLDALNVFVSLATLRKDLIAVSKAININEYVCIELSDSGNKFVRV